MTTSRGLIPAILLGPVLVARHAAVAAPPPTPPDATDHPLSLNLKNLHWDRILPALGKSSPTISILHKDPKSGATRLLIRVPKDFHITPHWHSANETHTVLQGIFVMRCMGKQDTLREAGFNYVPARMVHEAWTTERLGALLFITVDGPWDVNFVSDLPRSMSTERAMAPKPR
jgi:mannose-6-phosphate isomerase-like protein (cupin superfamily)